MQKPRTKKFRTETFLASVRGDEDEWAKLWAVMLLEQGWDYRDAQRLRQLVDMVAVAERIDELTADLRKKVQAAIAESDAILGDREGT